MKFWLDAQIPPAMAGWMEKEFRVEVAALRDLGLRDAQDAEIFQAAKKSGIVIVSKDRDFLELVTRLGSPLQLLWLTCGNLTNKHLQRLFVQLFPQVMQLLSEGEPVVEIGSKCERV